jgi:hypothetical protein
MSYFDDASLVMIPSGYKTSKVYSVKPTNGTGDLTFTRSNDTATRVGPDGLIEKVRTNLALYSEDLTNAAWSNLSITVGANATTAPNGTTTADKITPTTSNTNHLIYSNVITSAGEYSFSVYVKAAGYSKVALRESQSVGFFASFDLTSGTILDSSSAQTNTITSVGDGWYRITSTRSYSGSINLGLIPLLDSYTSGDPLAAYAGDGTSGIFAWGAQMEFNVPTEYIGPTLGSAVSVGPVANVPRLDYLGSSCPRLLLEPQRQNVFTFSESFDNAAWTKSGATITANVAVSPDGYTNADLQTGGEIYQQKTQPNATACTMSVFVKKDTAASATIRYIDNVSGFVGGGITYTYATNAITILQSANASVSGEAISYGNGWYRLILKYTSAASVTFNYQGIQAGGSFIYGAQLETSAAYATSYVNTLNSAVTRGADAASKTGISSLIGQTEGTIYLEVDYSLPSGAGGASARFQLSDGSTGEWMLVSYPDAGSSAPRFYINNGASDANVSSSANMVQGTNKIAAAYQNGDYVLYLNGVLVGVSSASIGVPSTSRIDMQGNAPTDAAVVQGAFKQALLFKTRLSNADLAALTA